jgi:hypothetical protein
MTLCRLRVTKIGRRKRYHSLKTFLLLNITPWISIRVCKTIVYVFNRSSNKLQVPAVLHLRMQSAVNTWHENTWPQSKSVCREEEENLMFIVKPISAFRALRPLFPDILLRVGKPKLFLTPLPIETEAKQRQLATCGDYSSIVNCR